MISPGLEALGVKEQLEDRHCTVVHVQFGQAFGLYGTRNGLDRPADLAFDASGNLSVVISGNDRTQDSR
ncbi:MAG: hypothetical protein AB7O59_02645 [Pirellulales bacterium]